MDDFLTNKQKNKTMYQILLRFDEKTGRLKGASTQESVYLNPRDIKPEDWPKQCDSIRNASMMTTADVDAVKKELEALRKAAKAELDASEKKLTDFKAVVIAEATKLKAAVLDPNQKTDEAALAAVEQVLATETERKILALKAKQTDLATELARLGGE